MAGFSLGGGAPPRIGKYAGKATGLLASGSGSKDWIGAATKNKGGLHKSLGVAHGKKIPAGKIAVAAKKGGKVGKQARLAQTLAKMRGGR